MTQNERMFYCHHSGSSSIYKIAYLHQNSQKILSVNSQHINDTSTRTHKRHDNEWKSNPDEYISLRIYLKIEKLTLFLIWKLKPRIIISHELHATMKKKSKRQFIWEDLNKKVQAVTVKCVPRQDKKQSKLRLICSLVSKVFPKDVNMEIRLRFYFKLSREPEVSEYIKHRGGKTAKSQNFYAVDYRTSSKWASFCKVQLGF